MFRRHLSRWTMNTWTFLDGGRLLPSAAGARVVLRRQRRSETEDKENACSTCSEPLCACGCLSVCSVRLVCSFCSVAVLSIPFPFLAMLRPARAALRAASSCSPSCGPAVGGTPSNKPSGAWCLVLRQLTLRPGRSETSVERLSLSCAWVRHVSMRGTAPHAEADGAQLHHISSQACTFFLFLKIGRRNPLQDLTPLPIRAGSLLLAQAVIPPRLHRRFILHIYMDSCQW